MPIEQQTIAAVDDNCVLEGRVDTDDVGLGVVMETIDRSLARRNRVLYCWSSEFDRPGGGKVGKILVCYAWTE